MPYAGWTFWIVRDAQVRQLSIAVADENSAREAILEANPGWKSVAHHAMAEDLVRKLGLKAGKTIEWSPIDQSRTIKPPPGTP